MGSKLPDVLGKLNYHPKSILDLGCGEGTFAREASQLGFEVTGVDKAPEMIKIARNKVENNQKVDFLKGDMRKFSLDDQFDLITSWFDSINYLLTDYDLREALKTAYELLREEGFFIFDVNTIHGLSVEWQEESCYVQRDDSRVFEVHRTDYDSSRRIASLKITFFQRKGNSWEKYEEIHRERGYRITRIEELAEEVGFSFESVWGDLERFSPPDDESGRVWIALYKGG
ncbi:MAG: class I SAM-dependent methyltransferase [Candidatus Bipolaricaulota bacterium]